jgi:acetolactate synthase-1/2/3 large subunit
MNTAEAIVKILENEDVKFIFGVPGEQIIGFYNALSKSNIKHILCRNEQSASIAADVYGRISKNFGVCLATAGPGALNLIMGVATAFKDSVPLLVITGDVPTFVKGKNTMQDIDLFSIFKPITMKNYSPKEGKIAIENIKEAIKIIKKEPRGPIHINLAKDVLADEDIVDVINKEIEYNPQYDYCNLNLAIEKLKSTKKPLLIIGEGVRRSNSIDDVKDLIKKYKIPTVYTYNANGILSQREPLNLGMVGIMGNPSSYYAFKNSDLILVLGANLNERTLNIEFEQLDKFDEYSKKFGNKIIHVNIDKSTLKGNVKIHGDVKEVLKKIKNETILQNINKSWTHDILKNKDLVDKKRVYDDDKQFLKPQNVVEIISKDYNDSLIINDAGSHTSWVTLFINPNENGRLINSGGLIPMGYGLPGAIGAAIANLKKEIIAIVGDGGFQMNIQELATIAEHNLSITIFILNNNQLGIIKQWEEYFYDMDPYAVDLKNPDFIAISKAYGIDGQKVLTENELILAIKKSKLLKKPYIIEVIVSNEIIPALDKNLN